MSEIAKNTDRELWREREGDYYADSIHVTQDGSLGINVGGLVHCKRLKDWHALVLAPKASPEGGAASLRDKIDANLKATGDWMGRTPKLVEKMEA